MPPWHPHYIIARGVLGWVLSPPGVLTTFTNLYEFAGTGDGNWPNWGGFAPAFSLGTFDGYLYGATIGTLFKWHPATYGWSIVNGTIIGPTNTPSIRWIPTVTNGVVTICVTVTDSSICTTTACTSIIAYTGEIAAGGAHSLAVLTNGTLWAWGLDNSGQLGDGGSVNQDAPEPLTGCVTQQASPTWSRLPPVTLSVWPWTPPEPYGLAAIMDTDNWATAATARKRPPPR